MIEFLYRNREAEQAEAERLAQEEILKEKEARKEGLRKRKPVFSAKEKTDEELKGYSKLNMELRKGEAVKAVASKVEPYFASYKRQPFKRIDVYI